MSYSTQECVVVPGAFSLTMGLLSQGRLVSPGGVMLYFRPHFQAILTENSLLCEVVSVLNVVGTLTNLTTYATLLLLFQVSPVGSGE